VDGIVSHYVSEWMEKQGVERPEYRDISFFRIGHHFFGIGFRGFSPGWGISVDVLINRHRQAAFPEKNIGQVLS
jgi:hypothetical protein